MFRSIVMGVIFLGAVVYLGVNLSRNSATAATAIPNPAVDDPLAGAKSQQSVVVSGGCFWGIQAVFEHVKGVTSATAGYSGGAANTADYETVSEGKSGHAESVKIVYDPSQVSFGTLLKVFFSVAHDPTELNRQGPDYGKQYRSIIFYSTDGQHHIAQAYIDQLNSAKVFHGPIVTEVVPLKAFYPAEDYHQDYAIKHPDNPYIMMNDAPKVENLRKQCPDLYRKN
ncbi:MAG TPA: peptide-methionine (S)-S-oxide reductase MsrA [Candidatus Acidoferrales bacterium]|nr:peptide-methionine (S)-S-oxide reductase MsrA [Candidatus Acidoferrales bacterium]